MIEPEKYPGLKSVLRGPGRGETGAIAYLYRTSGVCEVSVTLKAASFWGRPGVPSVTECERESASALRSLSCQYAAGTGGDLPDTDHANNGPVAVSIYPLS